MLLALEGLDLLADGARFFLGVPRAGDADLQARLVFGPQRLAEPALIVRDQVRGGGEDMCGRAVVALEADHLRAGEIVLEAQDVVPLCAAPAVDRLVVVADAADILGNARRCRNRSRGLGLLPLSACGERVGVRGSFQKRSVTRVPLTRRAARVDLSPQAGRGGGGGGPALDPR